MSELSPKTVDPSANAMPLDHIEAVGHLANQEEHEETAFQALKKCPKVVMWSCFGLWVLTLASYDSYAGGIAIGIPEFRKAFGTEFEGEWIIPANWLSAFSGGPQAS